MTLAIVIEMMSAALYEQTRSACWPRDTVTSEASGSRGRGWPVQARTSTAGEMERRESRCNCSAELQRLPDATTARSSLRGDKGSISSTIGTSTYCLVYAPRPWLLDMIPRLSKRRGHRLMN